MASLLSSLRTSTMLLTSSLVLSHARVQKLPALDVGAGSAFWAFMVLSTSSGRLSTALSRRSRRRAVAETLR